MMRKKSKKGKKSLKFNGKENANKHLTTCNFTQ